MFDVNIRRILSLSIFRRAPEFKKEYPFPLSFESSEWCAHLSHITGKAIRFARNAQEHRVGKRRIPVDGYCEATNEVFQFHG